MKGIIDNASLDSGGYVVADLTTSTIPGYNNISCSICFDPGHYAIPLSNTLLKYDLISDSDLAIHGFYNYIADANLSISSGDTVNYSATEDNSGSISYSWYQVVSNNGVYIQEANTSNKENQMMGQSTNKVLLDIMELLEEIVTFLSTHTHSGVTTGVGISGISVLSPPSTTTITKDNTYISSNENLAITNVYKPYS